MKHTAWIFEIKEYDVLPDICSSSPCANGGTCLPHADGYICECKTAYTGPRCQSGMSLTTSVLRKY